MLAIVIPYYKKAYFRECLDSLAEQSNKNFKVYIGDDASPENPKNLLQEYEGKINFEYHRFSENLGQISLTRQWHRCINLSDGEEWLMILGDDDFLSSNYVEEFYENLPEIERLNINVVRFASRIVRSPSNELSHLYTHPKIERSTDFFYRKFLKFSRGSLTEQIFARSAFEKHGFRDFELGWGADNFAWLDFTDFGSVYSINTAIAYFRISESNISRGGFEMKRKQNLKYLYFTLLIEKYLGKFRKDQRIPLLLFYEQIVYNSNQASIKFFFKMIYLFGRNSAYVQVLKFSRRFTIYHLNGQ